MRENFQIFHEESGRKLFLDKFEGGIWIDGGAKFLIYILLSVLDHVEIKKPGCYYESVLRYLSQIWSTQYGQINIKSIDK